MSFLSDELIRQVERWLQIQAEKATDKLAKFELARWDGLQEGTPTAYTDDGKKVSGPLRSGVKALRRGDKVWWDGQRFHSPPVKEPPKLPPKGKPVLESQLYEVFGDPEVAEENPAMYIMWGIQRWNRWREVFFQTPSGYYFQGYIGDLPEYRPVGPNLDAKDFFLANDYWMTKCKAPGDYSGWHYQPETIWRSDSTLPNSGGLLYSYTDWYFVYPYLHELQVNPENKIQVSFAWSYDYSCFNMSERTQVITPFTFERSLNSWTARSPFVPTKSTQFCGATSSWNTRIYITDDDTRSDVAENPTAALSNLQFQVGDVITLDMVRDCDLNYNPDECWGVDGPQWTPNQWQIYTWPTGATPAGVSLKLTKIDIYNSNDPDVNNSIRLSGIPTPYLTNGQIHEVEYSNSYGYPKVDLFDMATLNYFTFTQQDLTNYWKTVNYDLWSTTVYSSGFVFEDQEGNTPEDPQGKGPIPQHAIPPSSFDGDVGRFTLISSRDGVFYGYKLWFYQKLEGSLEAQFSSRSNDPNYQGCLGVGSRTSCSFRSESDDFPYPDKILPQEEWPNNFNGVFAIVGIRVDTLNKTITYKSKDNVAYEAPKAEGQGPYYVTLVKSGVIFEDDPRIVDGFVRDEYQYHYDTLRGRLWFFDFPKGPTAEEMRARFYQMPDGVNYGGQTFVNWVNDDLLWDGSAGYDGEAIFPCENRRELNVFGEESGPGINGFDVFLGAYDPICMLKPYGAGGIAQ